MIIKITNFSIGVHNFRFEKSTDELQLNEQFINNLILDCNLDKSQHQIVINCNLTIFVHLNCDRCNSIFNPKINKDFTLTYLFEEGNNNENIANVKYLSYAKDTIDLTEDVVDYAKLSLPMKKLCSEDCKGLCMNCGINLNQKKCNCKTESNTSVWEPLLKLKDNLN